MDVPSQSLDKMQQSECFVAMADAVVDVPSLPRLLPPFDTPLEEPLHNLQSCLESTWAREVTAGYHPQQPEVGKEPVEEHVLVALPAVVAVEFAVPSAVKGHVASAADLIAAYAVKILLLGKLAAEVFSIDQQGQHVCLHRFVPETP